MPDATTTQPLPARTLLYLAAIYRSRRRIGTVLAIAFAVVIGHSVFMGKNGISVYQQKSSEDRTLQQEINQLQEENQQLKLHVERLKNDPDAIEHEARERLHYARPGEVIYTLNPKPSTGSAQGAH